MKHSRRSPFYQPPTSPLARLGLALAGIGILALSFMLGLFVLAIAMGLALIGGVVIAVRRLLAGKSSPEDEARGPIDVEYRVIHRSRGDRGPD
ncbi:hypothetical protein [Wenzhouxiangella limi]|uniref:Uncharacterized protein n=1 Tax=Wenzhouxiangella limi TaxID=2707351 RepID=A0A845VFF2_9GAMM|nr:hypothetical protein [Wenzhouxiangella limi]NDY95949.1 hypothetical protein [Wenzhouxiangella limi]